MYNKLTQVIVVYTHNISRVIRVHELPRPGETVRAIGMSEGVDGAKGTNVAVVLARLGVNNALVAQVRSIEVMESGHKLLQQLGVDDTFITYKEDPNYARGSMIIDDHGNNMIVLSSSSKPMPNTEIEKALEAYKGAQYCVTGYELDEPSVRYTLHKAKQFGLTTVVNPSPVPDFLPDYWSDIDILVLNEHELIRMLEMSGELYEEWDWETRMRRLREIYACGNIVLTLGAEGFLLLEGEHIFSEPGNKVNKVIDTSGAGDSFLAAMVAGLCKGKSLAQACSWANYYAALTVQRYGTITSYLTLAEVEGIGERSFRKCQQCKPGTFECS